MTKFITYNALKRRFISFLAQYADVFIEIPISRVNWFLLASCLKSPYQTPQSIPVVSLLFLYFLCFFHLVPSLALLLFLRFPRSLLEIFQLFLIYVFRQTLLDMETVQFLCEADYSFAISRIVTLLPIYCNCCLSFSMPI